MERMASELAAQAHARISMILRRRLFTQKKVLLRFYKSFVMSYLEFATPTLYHATEYALSPLESVQGRMLNELEITEIDAISKYSLAPLRCRRDIVMAGLLHRINRKWASSILGKLDQLAPSYGFPRNLSDPKRRHNR